MALKPRCWAAKLKESPPHANTNTWCIVNSLEITHPSCARVERAVVAGGARATLVHAATRASSGCKPKCFAACSSLPP